MSLILLLINFVTFLLSSCIVVENFCPFPFSILFLLHTLQCLVYRFCLFRLSHYLLLLISILPIVYLFDRLCHTMHDIFFSYSLWHLDIVFFEVLNFVLGVISFRIHSLLPPLKTRIKYCPFPYTGGFLDAVPRSIHLPWFSPLFPRLDFLFVSFKKESFLTIQQNFLNVTTCIFTSILSNTLPSRFRTNISIMPGDWLLGSLAIT